ncbi:MAG: type II toxin-antitoxin system VapC family toxin [Sulfurisoma sp.]|nr:type II toxin-antitoxin system VapC family toxin [Sulfurisoma sp.]
MAIPRIYVETSVISYLTSRPSRDLVIAARQETTREWWELRNQAFQPLISNLVLQELAAGDPDAALARVRICRTVDRLAIEPAAKQLAAKLIETHAVPATEEEDALHIALATIAQVEYIATWNFAHMVSPAAKYRLQKHIEQLGFASPLLATPEELLETLP